MTDSRAVDQESRRLVRFDLLTNILLEAGAGSGKTQMLAERMAAGVAEGVYSVEHLAAVTFTRKAASELRGRFHIALEKQLTLARQGVLPGGLPDPQRVSLLQSALANLERFFGGTIHSFCARLLRERPVESGVSPGFTELDEEQDLALRHRAWRDFISNCRAAAIPDAVALADTGVRVQDLDSAFATICGNDDVDFPPGDAECPDPKPPLKALVKFWKELQTHLPQEIAANTTCPIQKTARDFRAQWRVSQDRVDRPAVVATLLESWDCESNITQKWWPGTSAETKLLRDLIQKLHQEFHAAAVEPYLSQWRQYVYRLALTLLLQARTFAATERRRLNCLNYGDLLNLTARVLRENPEVRAALQQKFRHVLVDEFQDTDPVQAEILFWLAEDGAASSTRPRPAADWRTVRLRPGALFVVGDPKQSIYRFRRADIDIYNIVRQRFSAADAGRVLPLTCNFRSIPSLCDWANRVFHDRFPAKPTAHAPAFAALDADLGNQAVGGVFTLTHTSASAEVQNHDAEKIASYIRSEVDAGRCQFSDFLILTRKKQGIATYARALESFNIPLEASGAGAFGESDEVAVLTSLLRALAAPRDALSLVAVLRGGLFGVSDQELFNFKQAGGWFSLFHGAGEVNATALEPRVDASLRALRQYYRWTRMLPAAAALDRILEDTGYLAFAATTPGGADAGDLLHAVDRVRQVAAQGGSLADAADALEADGDSSSEVESLPLEPGRSNVVRLMNLHKAKGLEAEVVFLADPAGGVQPRIDVHIERAGLAARGWLKITRKSEGSYAAKLLAQPAGWDQHEAAELPYLEAEEDRLLYVAATRARRMLVVSRWTGKARCPAWIALNPFLDRAEELPVGPSVTVAEPSPLDCQAETQAVFRERLGRSHAQVSQASWAVTSVTAEAQHIIAATRSFRMAADDPSQVVTADTPAHRADAGMAWGTLIHGLLEHAMRQKDVTADDLKRLAMWLTVEEPQLRVVLDVAVNTVLQVSKAEFWAAARKSDRSVEAPFAFMEKPNGILTGVIDLFHKQELGWKIVDYKTDLGSPAAVVSYQEQLKMYERALASVGLQDVTSVIQPVRSS